MVAGSATADSLKCRRLSKAACSIIDVEAISDRRLFLLIAVAGLSNDVVQFG
jgi:hypothetical protein